MRCQNLALWVLAGGRVIKLVRWLRVKWPRRQSQKREFLERRISGFSSGFSSASAPASGSDHHDLNQEWEIMDSLEPWADAEIDRLQARFKLPDIDKT